MKARATDAAQASTVRTLLQEVLDAAKSLQATARQRNGEADSDDAHLLVALDVLTTKAKHLRTTVGRRWAAASALENAAVRALLAEPRFAGARVELPALANGFVPDVMLVTADGTTYVEIKAGRDQDLAKAAARVDAWLTEHAPTARGLVVGVNAGKAEVRGALAVRGRVECRWLDLK